MPTQDVDQQLLGLADKFRNRRYGQEKSRRNNEQQDTSTYKTRPNILKSIKLNWMQTNFNLKRAHIW